ncbi:MAG TPA: 1,6-anhydro-N-acetylmuramyl-L-alanine amidase AmpD [Burkholderiaceae bacterium]|nr:1,6-anhydro-N-acetylmuramyl-L-alanine amidase AmpD [Burkholderiaceae bacterium]
MGPVDAAGWVAGVTRVVSPFFDARPPSTPVELVIIHNISLPPGVFGTGDVVRLFTGMLDAAAHPFFAALAGARLSTHFFIDRAGDMIQFVPTADRAWHAGISSFESRPSCNDFSLGIELEGTDFIPFTDAQYRSLCELVVTLRAAHPLRAIRGHSEVAADRKTDPGPYFDWARLRADARLDPALFAAPRA